MHHKRRREISVSTETATAPINKLPPEVLCLILSKLPPRSVCVCRSVLKSWNQLIQQPFFIKLHHSASPLSIMVVYCTPIYSENPTRFGFVELSSRNSRFRGYTLNVADQVIHTPRLGFNLVGSCNGLICLKSLYDCNRLVVCHPMLGLPYMELGGGNFPLIGLGYIPSLNQYKVVKVAYERDTRHIVPYVCTVDCCRKRKITSSAWRKTTGFANDADGLIPNICGWSSPAVFFRGTIIWITGLECDREESCLIYFDVEKELLQTLSLRPDIIGRAVLGVGVYYDHEGIDHLYICETKKSCSNIWLIGTYKCVESSYMRLKWQGRIKWVIQVPDNGMSPMKLLKVFEDGKLLISIQNSKLVHYLAHYDPSTGVLETIDSLQLPEKWNELVLDTPSLLGCIDTHEDTVRRGTRIRRPPKKFGNFTK